MRMQSSELARAVGGNAIGRVCGGATQQLRSAATQTVAGCAGESPVLRRRFVLAVLRVVFVRFCAHFAAALALAVRTACAALLAMPAGGNDDETRAYS